MPTPEQKARKQIEDMLSAAGWTIQDKETLNLTTADGIAVRKFPLKKGTANYLPFVDHRAVGAMEAKKLGERLSVVANQTEKYLTGLPPHLRRVTEPLPSGYESTSVETNFRDLRDADSRSRRVFSFHHRETIRDWLRRQNSLRHRLRYLPPLNTDGLRDFQIEAIVGMEKSLVEARPRVQSRMRNRPNFCQRNA